jgi:hypothetical protein
MGSADLPSRIALGQFAVGSAGAPSPRDAVLVERGASLGEGGRAASTLAELRMEPFQDLTRALPGLAEKATRLATDALRSAAAASEESDPNAAESKGCEGGDLNPYASYGASTSS